MATSDGGLVPPVTQHPCLSVPSEMSFARPENKTIGLLGGIGPAVIEAAGKNELSFAAYMMRTAAKNGAALASAAAVAGHSLQHDAFIYMLGALAGLALVFGYWSYRLSSEAMRRGRKEEGPPPPPCT